MAERSCELMVRIYKQASREEMVFLFICLTAFITSALVAWLVIRTITYLIAIFHRFPGLPDAGSNRRPYSQ
jgi:hypothetical protein